MTQLSDIQSSFCAVACRGMAVALLSVACGKSTVPKAESPKRFGAADEPAFVIGAFSGLPKADQNPVLPVLINPNGDAADNCYTPLTKASTWQTANPRVLDLLKKNERAVTSAVSAWTSEELQPENKAPFADPAGWRVEITAPVVRHVFPAEMQLAENHNCMDDATRDFPIGARTMTTAFGAREFTLTSPAPIPAAQIRALRGVALTKKVRLVPVNAYTPALDENGKQRRGPKKEKLFNSPSGELIPGKKVPLPKFRDAVSFKLVFQEPLFFAEGELPSGAWKKEAAPESCEVFLVYYDAVPQVPACPDFNAAGFGVAPSKKAGHVIIKAAGLRETTETETAFGAMTRMTVDGHIQLWVTAAPVEEGAHLKIDSLVLDTGNETPPIMSFPSADKKKHIR